MNGLRRSLSIPTYCRSLLRLARRFQYNAAFFHWHGCEEGVVMKKLFVRTSLVAATALLVGALPVLANAPGGDAPPDYSGITGMYYTLIGLVLAYGVYDTFFKKS